MDKSLADCIGVSGAKFPIIQAPMANASTTELAIAVARAGAVGSIAAGMLGPKQISAEIASIRAATDGPFTVNLFASTPAPPDPDKFARARELAAQLERETGADSFPYEAPPPPAPFREQLAAVVEAKVPAVSFTFGVPSDDELSALRASGARLTGTATSAEEAEHLARLGFDAIVAQGIEAGGHRGSFLTPERDGMPTLDLVARCAGFGVPVIASGGIMDGRQVKAALAAGAAAVQMGTAFLACPETKLPPPWREAVLAGRDTVLTRTITGKHARAIRNRLIEFMEEFRDELPDFPYVAVATGRLRAWAAAEGNGEYLPLLAGKKTAEARTMRAAELVATLVEEMAAA